MALKKRKKQPKLRSFEEWSKRGHRIKRGAKCVCYREGTPVFSEDQTYRVNLDQEEANELAEELGDDAFMFGADF
jgi:predicted TIM-barrel fold metal-dependent hydrolase